MSAGTLTKDFIFRFKTLDFIFVNLQNREPLVITAQWPFQCESRTAKFMLRKYYVVTIQLCGNTSRGPARVMSANDWPGSNLLLPKVYIGAADFTQLINNIFILVDSRSLCKN